VLGMTRTAWPWHASLHGADDFSYGESFFQVADSLANSAWRTRSVDDRCGLPRFNERLQEQEGVSVEN
jgi:hypothetical protein